MANNFAWSPNSAWLAWLSREPTKIQALGGLMVYSMRDQSFTFIPYAPGESTEMSHELIWEPHGRYLYLTTNNALPQRFDLACLETSCEGLQPEKASSGGSQEWAKYYYPQWNLEPVNATP